MKSYFFEFALFSAIFLLLSSECLSVNSGSRPASPSASHGGHSDENMNSTPSSPLRDLNLSQNEGTSRKRSRDRSDSVASSIPASPPASPTDSFDRYYHEKRIPKTKLTAFHRFIPSENEGTSRKRSRGKNVSGMSSSSSSSDRSLTPISDTDSASSHSKQFTSGTPQFHEKGYNFHHHMAKYHKVISKAYEDRTDSYNKAKDHNVKLHTKAFESSIAKKVKHRKDYQGIKKGNLQPGPIQDKTSMNKVPQIPTREVADDLVNSRKIIFRKGKGYRHLTAKRLPYGQRRVKESNDMYHSSSSSEAE